MDRIITVKGIGHITAKPDYVVIYMTIDATNKKYEKAVEEASDKIDDLSSALIKTGLEKDDLKTVDFRINIATGYKKNIRGVGETVNLGYTCTNRIKLSFDFESEKLSEVIDTITTCVSDPKINVTFTVKDEEAVKDELLKSAGTNARRRAEILCEAAGAKLGKLVSVNYNWNEISVLSPTQFGTNYLGNTAQVFNEDIMYAPKSIQPDDIDLSDNAVFVWEIV